MKSIRYGFMDKRGLQKECKGNPYFSKSDGVGNNLRSGFEKFRFTFLGAARKVPDRGPWPHSTPLKVRRGRFSIRRVVRAISLKWRRMHGGQNESEWMASEILESWMLLAHHGKEGDCFSLKDLLNLTCFLSIFLFFSFLFFSFCPWWRGGPDSLCPTILTPTMKAYTP